MELKNYTSEPYRIFFPLGILFLLIGTLLWVPQIWNPTEYPVLFHRSLLLNGFVGCFIGGFLMTAIPRFSQTELARNYEAIIYLIITVLTVCMGHLENETLLYVGTILQPLFLLFYMIPRMLKRKQDPPKSFIFVFSGIVLWLISGVGQIFFDPEIFKRIQYEGAIASIIFGVGGRLIPGILGHVDVIQASPQNKKIPVDLIFSNIIFIGSYFVAEEIGNWARAIVSLYIGFEFWMLYKYPKKRTSLTLSIWISAWLICLSFILRAVWSEGMIHVGHSFFINGITLLSLLIAIRVIQSHGPKDETLENKKIIYVVTGLLILSAATRVSAYLMPDHYQSHLGYSAIILDLAIFIWLGRYLRPIFTILPH